MNPKSLLICNITDRDEMVVQLVHVKSWAAGCGSLTGHPDHDEAVVRSVHVKNWAAGFGSFGKFT